MKIDITDLIYHDVEITTKEFVDNLDSEELYNLIEEIMNRVRSDREILSEVYQIVETEYCSYLMDLVDSNLFEMNEEYSDNVDPMIEDWIFGRTLCYE